VSPWQRVEAAVTLFTRVVPVAARRMLFRSLDTLEQCHLGVRLGWSTVAGRTEVPPTARYRLDLARPDDAAFARRLVGAAIREKAANCLHNTSLNGRRLPPMEDSHLQAVLVGPITHCPPHHPT